MNYAEKLPLSLEEAYEIAFLGGIDSVSECVNQILRDHGVKRSLFTADEIEEISNAARPSTSGISFCFRPNKSLQSNIRDLLKQAQEIHAFARLLHHLIGATLDIVLGEGKIDHNPFSTSNQSSDFAIDNARIYVTTSPGEGLILRCADNLKNGLCPVIVTIAKSHAGASSLASIHGFQERVDIIEAEQFIVTNLYKWSLFKATEKKITVEKLLARYNEIVSVCETDPGLRISFSK